MFTKTSMLFIAALCLVQGIGAQTPSLEEAITDALKKAESQVAHSAVQDGANQLQVIAHSLILNGQSILGNFSVQIQNITDGLNDAVQQVIGDVPKCVTDEQSVALQLLSSTTVNLGQCVAVEVVQVEALVNEAASLAQEAFLLPQQAASNVTACMANPFTYLFCIANVVSNFGSESQRIVAEVTDIVQKGKPLLLNGPLDIAACAERAVDNTAAQVRKTIVNIAQCVVDGSNTTTTPSN